MLEMQVQSLEQEDPLKEEMSTHSSILAGKTPWTVAFQAGSLPEEPGRLQSMGSQKAGHN